MQPPNPKVEIWLAALRHRLRGLPATEIDDIVAELRSHIADKDQSADATLAALGRPEEIAALYLSDNVQVRATGRWSPLRLLKTLFRWASVSFAGLTVFIGALFGYSLGGAFILCGLVKPLFPQYTGLWEYPDAGHGPETSLRMGFGPLRPGGHELLGYWIVPICLFVGAFALYFTTRMVSWFAATYARSRKWPHR